MTVADKLWQAEYCHQSCVFAGIFIGSLIGLTDRARPVWRNTERIWENTRRSRWKKLRFCEHVSRSERDKGNTVFRWAGAEEAGGVHC